MKRKPKCYLKWKKANSLCAIWSSFSLLYPWYDPTERRFLPKRSRPKARKKLIYNRLLCSVLQWKFHHWWCLIDWKVLTNQPKHREKRVLKALLRGFPRIFLQVKKLTFCYVSYLNKYSWASFDVTIYKQTHHKLSFCQLSPTLSRLIFAIFLSAPPFARKNWKYERNKSL